MTDDQARVQYRFVVDNARNYFAPSIEGNTSDWWHVFTLDTGRHAYMPHAAWLRWHKEGLGQ